MCVKFFVSKLYIGDMLIMWTKKGSLRTQFNGVKYESEKKFKSVLTNKR